MAKSKISGVIGPDSYKPESKMSLEGKHASAIKGHKVGDMLNIMVSGKKSSHYQNADGSITVPEILVPYVGKNAITKAAA